MGRGSLGGIIKNVGADWDSVVAHGFGSGCEACLVVLLAESVACAAVAAAVCGAEVVEAVVPAVLERDDVVNRVCAFASADVARGVACKDDGAVALVDGACVGASCAVHAGLGWHGCPFAGVFSVVQGSSRGLPPHPLLRRRSQARSAPGRACRSRVCVLGRVGVSCCVRLRRVCQGESRPVMATHRNASRRFPLALACRPVFRGRLDALPHSHVWARARRSTQVPLFTSRTLRPVYDLWTLGWGRALSGYGYSV